MREIPGSRAETRKGRRSRRKGRRSRRGAEGGCLGRAPSALSCRLPGTEARPPWRRCSQKEASKSLPAPLPLLFLLYHCADGPERNSSLRLGSQCRTSSNQLQVSEPVQGQHEHPSISHWFSQGRSPCLAAAPSRVPRQAVIPLGHCGHQSQQPQLHCLRRHRNILLVHKAPQGHNQMEGTKHLSFLLQPSSHRSERMLW